MSRKYTYKSKVDCDGEVWNVFTQDRIQAGPNNSYIYLVAYLLMAYAVRALNCKTSTIHTR